MAAYFALRLVYLTRLPLFADEGTYLWWGNQLLRGDLTRGLGQGKPLVGWLVAVARASGLEPIFASRAAVGLVGGLGMASTGWMASRVFAPRVGLVAMALWVLLPFNLIFERVVTPDQILGSLGAVALAVTWYGLQPDSRTWTAVAAGALWVAAALAKLPVSVFFFAAPLLLVVLTPRPQRPVFRRVLALYTLPALLAAGVGLIAGYRWWQGLAPVGFGFDELLLKTDAGQAHVAANALAVLDWLVRYLTWPGAALLAAGWLATWVSGPPLARLSAALVTAWLALFVPIAEYWVPRYMLPVLPLAILLMAWTGEAGCRALGRHLAGQLPTSSHRWIVPLPYLIGLMVLAVAAAPLTLAVIANPEAAPWAAEDRVAFVEGYGAGYGFSEAAAYLDARIADNPTLKLIAMDIKDAERLRVYLSPEAAARVEQMHIVNGQNQTTPQMIARVQGALAPGVVTYLLMGSREQWTPGWQAALPQAVLEQAFDRPGGRDAVLLFRVDTAN